MCFPRSLSTYYNKRRLTRGTRRLVLYTNGVGSYQFLFLRGANSMPSSTYQIRTIFLIVLRLASTPKSASAMFVVTRGTFLAYFYGSNTSIARFCSNGVSTMKLSFIYRDMEMEEGNNFTYEMRNLRQGIYCNNGKTSIRGVPLPLAT